MVTIRYNAEVDSYIFAEDRQNILVPRDKVWERDGKVLFQLGDVWRMYDGPLPARPIEERMIEEDVIEEESLRESIPAATQPERISFSGAVEAPPLPAPASLSAAVPAPERRKGGRPKGSKNRAKPRLTVGKGKVK